VSDDYEEQKYMMRANGHRAVYVTAALKEKQNIIAVNQTVLPVVENFKKGLPKNMAFLKIFDQHEG
jgi:multidrug efflux pump subunit AcrB